MISSCTRNEIGISRYRTESRALKKIPRINCLCSVGKVCMKLSSVTILSSKVNCNAIKLKYLLIEGIKENMRIIDFTLIQVSS